MFNVGMHVQLVDSGELGTIVGIASAKQLLTVRTRGGELIRVTGDSVRKLDQLEWQALLGVVEDDQLRLGAQ